MKLAILLTLCLNYLPLEAIAADVRETWCKTTEECQQEANHSRGVITQDAASALTNALHIF